MSRQKIIDAAVNVFSKSGYHRASMDEIAEMAGVAKGTLYYHFPSKSKLFEALVTEGMDMIMGQVKKEIDYDQPVTEQVKGIIRCNVSLYVEYSELAKIFFNELSSGIEQDTLNEINGLRDKYIDFLAEVLREGYSGGEIRPMNFQLAAAGIIGLLDGACKYYLRNGQTVKLEDINEVMFTIISSGLLGGIN